MNRRKFIKTGLQVGGGGLMDFFQHKCRVESRLKDLIRGC